MKIFYSWQSDLPNATNRGLIETALKTAARRLRGDETLDVELVIERDTLGAAGAPDIKETILKKIDECDIFVADVSIIHPRSRRPAPNPNVLYELGYAVKQLTMERVLLVQNTAYGSPEKLPFDLRSHRTITYRSREDDASRSEARNSLANHLERGLRTVIEGIELEAPPEERLQHDWSEAIARYHELSNGPYVSVTALPGKAASPVWEEFRRTAADHRLVFGYNIGGWPAFGDANVLEWQPRRGLTIPLAPERFWEVGKDGALLFCSTRLNWGDDPVDFVGVRTCLFYVLLSAIYASRLAMEFGTANLAGTMSLALHDVRGAKIRLQDPDACQSRDPGCVDDQPEVQVPFRFVLDPEQVRNVAVSALYDLIAFFPDPTVSPLFKREVLQQAVLQVEEDHGLTQFYNATDTEIA